jgi:uncharacterized protein YaiE (UPF0345 family)
VEKNKEVQCLTSGRKIIDGFANIKKPVKTNWQVFSAGIAFENRKSTKI